MKSNLNQGKKTYTWLNKYHQSIHEYFSEVMSDEHYELFCILWFAYNINHQLKSAYFELLRVGDGWHTLTVHKRPDESIKVQLHINPNYGNILERFV